MRRLDRLTAQKCEHDEIIAGLQKRLAQYEQTPTAHNDETERDSTDKQRQCAPQPHEPQNDAATQEFMPRLNEAQARLPQL